MPTITSLNGVKPNFFGQPVAELTNQNKVSLGVEYTPEETSIRSYLKTC